jgi:tetratricopeptide (TPR) repeat protein
VKSRFYGILLLLASAFLFVSCSAPTKDQTKSDLPAQVSKNIATVDKAIQTQDPFVKNTEKPVEQPVTTPQKSQDYDEKEVQKYYDKARELEGIQKYEDAINYYIKAEKILTDHTPKNTYSDLYLRRARLYYKIGDLNEAWYDYSTHINFFSQDYDAYNERGIVSYDSMDYETALGDYDAAIDITQDKDYIFYNRALTYYALERYYEAVDDFDKVISFNPQDYEAISYKGLCYTALGEYEKSISLQKEALKINPLYSIAYNEMGNASFYSFMDDDAIEYYTKAIELEENPNYYFNRAKVYLYNQRYDEAISDFIRTIELNPKDYEAFNQIGYCYYAQKNYTEAEEYFLSALDINYMYTPACYNLGLVYEKYEDYEKAIEYYNYVIDYAEPSDSLIEKAKERIKAIS